MQIKVGDYFAKEDMIKHGPVVWHQVRDKVRSQGFRVSGSYGKYEPSSNGDGAVIVLYPDGDLVHSFEDSAMDRLITIVEFLEMNKKRIKIRCNDITTTKLAMEVLEGLGFRNPHKDNILKQKHVDDIVGLTGDEHGCIYAIMSEHTFSNVYRNVDEVKYDLETRMININVVKPSVEVLGYNVNKDALTEWLKSNTIRSAA